MWAELAHMLVLFLGSWGTSTPDFAVATLIYIPPKKSSLPFRILASIYVDLLLRYSIITLPTVTSVSTLLSGSWKPGFTTEAGWVLTCHLESHTFYMVAPFLLQLFQKEEAGRLLEIKNSQAPFLRVSACKGWSLGLSQSAVTGNVCSSLLTSISLVVLSDF